MPKRKRKLRNKRDSASGIVMKIFFQKILAQQAE